MFKRERFSNFEKILLLHLNPVNIILHLIGIIWGVAALWNHNFWTFILVIIILPGIGGIYAFYTDRNLENYSRSFWGQVMLENNNKTCLILTIIAFLALILGFSRHDLVMILAGLFLAIAGHFYVRFKNG